jgi:hypothetical protein
MRKDQRQSTFRGVLKQAQAGPEASLISDAATWQIDLAAVPVQIKNDPKARPAVIIITADEHPIHMDLLGHPPSEPEDVAELFLAALKEFGIEEHGPKVVELRFEEIAELIGPHLKRFGIEVSVQPILDRLDEMLMDFRQAQGLQRSRHAPSIPDTWAAWNLPEPLVAELFEVAAHFYRAAPWRFIENEQLLSIEMESGSEWMVVVLGNAGETFGLALYQEISDVWHLYESSRMQSAFDRLSGAMISLTLVEEEFVPPKTRHEVRRAGWELAARDVYPDLAVLNTPGSGVSQARFRDLIQILRAVPAFAERHREDLVSRRPLKEEMVWTDPESGLTIGFANSLYPQGEAFTDPPAVLRPCSPEGPGAEPGAMFPFPDLDADDFDDESALWSPDGYERWLADQGVSVEMAELSVMAAEGFVSFFLEEHQGVPIRAVTEYDLRLYLHEWYPRKMHQDDEDTEAVPDLLLRFFEYLAKEEGIICPWLADALSPEERVCFARRWKSCPGSFFWDEGVGVWRQQAYEDLRDRLLMPTVALAMDKDHDGTGIGAQESFLQLEMGRHWLVWRDEMIASGVTEVDAVRDGLEARVKAWERAPNASLKGKTPLEVVQAERRRDLRPGLRGL